MQDAPQSTESQTEIDARLAQINAALAAVQSGQATNGTATATAEKTEEPIVGCPIDPAERLLCASCQ